MSGFHFDFSVSSAHHLLQVIMIWTPQNSQLVLAVYGIILITGIPGNLLSFYVLMQKVKQEAKPNDLLLLSLNISDLIFLFSLPIRIKEAADMGWNMSNFLCPIATYIFLVTLYNSTLHLMAISLERYMAVNFAIEYKLRRCPRHTAITSAIIWMINMAHCSIVFYMQYHFSDKDNAGLDPTNQTNCYWYFTSDQLNVLLPERLGIATVFIFLPLTICCFCYSNMIHRLSQTGNINSKKRLRAIGLAISTLLVFMICFIPFSAAHVQGFIDRDSPEWRVYAILCSSSNACLDPFIFYFSSKYLQTTFKDSIKQLFMWLQLPLVRLRLVRLPITTLISSSYK